VALGVAFSLLSFSVVALAFWKKSFIFPSPSDNMRTYALANSKSQQLVEKFHLWKLTLFIFSALFLSFILSVVLSAILTFIQPSVTSEAQMFSGHFRVLSIIILNVLLVLLSQFFLIKKVDASMPLLRQTCRLVILTWYGLSMLLLSILLKDLVYVYFFNGVFVIVSMLLERAFQNFSWIGDSVHIVCASFPLMLSFELFYSTCMKLPFFLDSIASGIQSSAIKLLIGPLLSFLLWAFVAVLLPVSYQHYGLISRGGFIALILILILSALCSLIGYALS
jgi:hypothetical protein